MECFVWKWIPANLSTIHTAHKTQKAATGLNKPVNCHQTVWRENTHDADYRHFSGGGGWGGEVDGWGVGNTI